MFRRAPASQVMVQGENIIVLEWFWLDAMKHKKEERNG